ncbi:MAG: hypothetical protein ACR2P5_00540 [Gammaproteobacteria bacterium]
MCGGGGGGVEQQLAFERERQARINQTVGLVNEAFADPAREEAYADQYRNVLELNRRELDRQHDNTARSLRFALARRGTAGGSADIDAREELLRRYNENVLRTAETAERSTNDLRRSDEQSRLSLIAQSQAGLDATSATQGALRSLDLNRQIANQNTQISSLGNLFSDFSDLYDLDRQRRGREEGTISFRNTIAPRPGSSGFGGTTT